MGKAFWDRATAGHLYHDWSSWWWSTPSPSVSARLVILLYYEGKLKTRGSIYHVTIQIFGHMCYGGYTLRSVIEAPLITREVLPETYLLLVIMAADAQARPFLRFQASC
jgi:hypothetical protein